MTFNQTFQSNIEGLSGALSKVEASSKEQVQLITLIKDIDIKRVAQANVTVLKELKECTGEIAVFNQYLHNVSNYLHSVNELNSNINEHLNRTAVIEKLGIFFEKEINQVAAREQYINEVVANVDNTLQKSFIKISENTKEVVTSLQNNSVSEFDALLKHYAKQKEEFSQMLQEQREEFIARNAETIELMKEIRNLADTKVVMNQLVETTKGQSAILEKLANSLKNQNVTSGGFREAEYGNDKGIVTPAFPKSIVYMVATITALAFMSFGLYAYNTFIEKSKVKPKAAKVVTTKAPVVKSNEIQKDQVDTTEIVNTANTSK